jgi:hypothetical protein
MTAFDKDEDNRVTLENFFRNNCDESGLIGSKYVLEIIQEKENSLSFSIKSSKQKKDVQYFINFGNKLIPIKKVKYAVSKRHSK